MAEVLDEVYSVGDIADWLRCSKRKVSDVATEHGIGANLKGRAGWRFTEADKLALWEAMRPKKPVVTRRRRRAA